MRLNHALVVLLFTIPLTAQEEPLPVVTARDAAPEIMLIATAVEPIRDFRGPTLAEAARANDFISFDALYREARQRGEPVAAYETLHELWVYSVTDPIGAFYGTDMYEKLARAYPGYAQFIEDYSVVDSHGNVFYPTAETREFVLARALEGRSPRVLLAGDGLAPPVPAPVGVDRSSRSERSERSDRVTDAPVVATTRPRAAARSAQRSTRAAAPAVVAPTAPVVAEAAPAPVAEAVAAPPIVPEIVSETAAPVVEDVPEPVVAAQPVAAPPTVVATVPQPAAAADASPTSRGILLIVIGLLGIGLLAVMFRAPKETLPAPVAKQPAAKVDEKPVAPVEPLKRPEGPQRASGKNRASGSRG